MMTQRKLTTVFSCAIAMLVCASETHAQVVAQRPSESLPKTVKGTMHVTIPIEGMACVSCSEHLAQQLSAIQGVVAATVDFETKQARVEFDAGKVSIDKLVAEINKAFTAGKPTQTGDA